MNAPFNPPAPTEPAAPLRRVSAPGAIAMAEYLLDVDAFAIRAPGKGKAEVRARALVVWCLRSFGQPTPYDQIGRELGGRDRKTVSAAHLVAIRLRLTDPDFAHACKLVVGALALHGFTERTA